MARLLLLTLCLTLILSFAAAQVANETITPATSVNATISAGNKQYTYYGCYGEPDSNATQGLRALNSGKMESRDDMTVATCLSYCADGGWALAGLEYTKECWCAPFITSLATKLDDSACDLACQGNTSEKCGGSLKLTVYEQKSGSKGAGVKAVHQAPVGSILALGVAMGVLLCLA
ncbi:WSC domain-containing protein [Diplocarpon rosae]|nr:WSC domain-containing protein [Diplocarpon rosae]